MSYETEAYDYIISLLREKYVSPHTEITGDTTLHHDLRLMGDDVQEFLVDIRKHYHANFRELDFNRFFKGEGWQLCLPEISLFRSDRKNKWKIPVTIDHLVKVCIRQSWFEPE